MPYVERTIEIHGAIEEVYALAKKMEDFPQFMPDVEKVTVLERKENRTVTEWVTNVEGTPIIWTEEDIFDDINHRISYRLLQGDLDKFDGAWIFKSCGDKTKVTLGVDFDFGIPSLTELIGPTLELKVRENTDMMLSAMKNKIEGRKPKEVTQSTIQ